jgi:hypothetical protein
MKQIINSAADVVDCLGGSTKLARLLDEKQGTVGQWKMRNKLPPHRYFPLKRLLNEKGFDAPPSVWGMQE